MLAYTDKQGQIPFWDHPALKGYKVLPDKYFPSITIENIISLHRRGRFDDTDILLLKVLGDSICSHEDQLRRYMSKIMSRSDVSKRLNKFREIGLADRWKVRIRGNEETMKPPAPFTLGIAGFKFLKHYYSDQYFLNPNRWDDLGIKAIQRYVSINELRCQLVEKKVIKAWKWNAVLKNNRKIKFPLAVAEIKTPKGHLNLLIDRAQMTQDFIGYFRTKLEQWKSVYEEHNTFPVTEFANNTPVVVVYASALTVAKEIHQQLLLDTYPFQIWVCCEEDLLTDGLAHSFYIPIQSELKKVTMNFL
ncbi:hypothetical protein DX928_23165 [Bacillus swezeyi]|uniref:Replication-relaxation n=2 Tax=Bacillus swezeyi TaxID=1925020 RepID=A0A5M8RHS9_9BACI|nr:hypothetical protein DX927_22925 [Bacillus swezeyi]KAA6471576.1 hypothetical protein DX928_23165 [Bacillus swezeyi]